MVQRGLEKKAPFSAGKNSVADAREGEGGRGGGGREEKEGGERGEGEGGGRGKGKVLIEMYATQLKKAGADDVYCFVTSNHRDFSAPDGDHRQSHVDLADIFSSPQSRHLYQVEGLHAGLLDY